MFGSYWFSLSPIIAQNQGGLPKWDTLDEINVLVEIATIFLQGIMKVIKEVFETDENINDDILAEQRAMAVEEKVLWNLSKLQKPFKYIVTCVILQNNGSGLCSSASCFWDNTTDGSVTVQWESSLKYCIVSVFGLAI
nr:dynein light chain Tctex-type 1-like [Parasteatoda tepidariorum]